MMTLQEIFDTVATHLLKQNAQSVSYDTMQVTRCTYRGEGGRKCAVGALITDACYLPGLETFTVTSENVRQALVCSGVFSSLPSRESPEVGLLNRLQSTHDNYEPAQWRLQLEGVALGHDLDPAILTL